jgi:hypothetical protein
MRANINILWVVAVWSVLVDLVYVVWSLLDVQEIEWVGTVSLLLTGILASLIAFYLRRSYKAQGGELPEDNVNANIDDGDPELGFYSPWSWWPIMLAGSAALAFLGIAAGFWITYVGVGVFLIAIVGWVYEYYRGFHAR